MDQQSLAAMPGPQRLKLRAYKPVDLRNLPAADIVQL